MPTIKCDYCEKEFEPKQRFCCDSCRANAFKSGMGVKENKVEEVEKPVKKITATAKAMEMCKKHKSWKITCGCK